MAALTYPSNRLITDATTSFTVTGANAATGANGALLDLGCVTLFPTNEEIDVAIAIPAMPNNTSTAANSGVTFTLADSADSNASNATNIAAVGVITIAGVASTGSLATTVYRKLPGATKRYLGVKSFGGANSGDNSATTTTANLLY